MKENGRCMGLYEIYFVRGSQNLNDEARKGIHSGKIDRGFTVYYYEIRSTVEFHKNMTI
jgi:hypothetical protein